MLGVRDTLLTASLLLGLIAAPVSQARAQWISHVHGPDVFGNTTVTAAAISSTGNGLVVQCDAKNTLDVAFLVPATEAELSQLAQSIPAELLVKVDTGPVKKFAAQITQWNNKFMGIVAKGRTPALVALVRAIGAATATVDVGVDIFGQQQSDSFGALGSTASIAVVIKNCALDKIVAPSPKGGNPPTQ